MNSQLLNQGKSIVDARNGGASGCVETGAFGTESYILTGYFNLTKIFEITLHNGVDPMSGKQIGIQTGDPRQFSSFEELLNAYKLQVNYFADIKIKGIFFTHLHGDHTAGLPEIDRSIPKIVGKGETIINVPFLYSSNHLNRKDKLLEIDNNSGISISPLESVIDIFGDGSFIGINTPGHSPSHMSFLLVTNTGPILLTGDASHTKYGFNNKIEPGWVENKEIAENSLLQLTKFHEEYPEVKIIYGHEE